MVITKDPTIDGYFEYDFTAALDGQEIVSIGAITIIPNGELAATSALANGTEALVFMIGGALGTTYATTVQATRTDGRTMDVDGAIAVAPRTSPLTPPLGRILTPASPHKLLNFPARYLDERLDYGIDWTTLLAGDTVVSTTAVVVDGTPSAGLILISQTADDNRLLFWANGGVEGTAALLRFEAITALGRTLEAIATLETITVGAVDARLSPFSSGA